MSEGDELRFSRQLSLPQIGSAGQARLESCALLVAVPGFVAPAVGTIDCSMTTESIKAPYDLDFDFDR